VTDGSIRHISNFGDRPPKVSVGVNADEGIAPIYGDIFGSSFSDMKRIFCSHERAGTNDAHGAQSYGVPDG
jgi:hypothetical protein